MRVTGFYIDGIGRVKPSFDPVDPYIEKNLCEYRINICNICENYIEERGTCKLCGCLMNMKRKMVFPLDEDGKAFDYQFRGRRRYVCKLKKW